MFNNFPPKIVRKWDVEKYCRASQVTDDNIIWPLRISCQMFNARDTHSEYLLLIAFPRQEMIRERASILRLNLHSQSCFMKFQTWFFWYDWNVSVYLSLFGQIKLAAQNFVAAKKKILVHLACPAAKRIK